MSNGPRKLLLTGSAGHLGQRVAQIAKDWELAHSWHINLPDHTLPGSAIQLDLRDNCAVHATFEQQRPTAIIHTACSNRSEAAIVPAARNLAEAAAKYSARMVHVSTDMVLDGKNAPYSDDAEAKPLNTYGQAKADAERVVSSLYPKAAIVRTSLIFGIGPLDHQTRWLESDIRAGKRVYLFIDELRCPIWVDTLAQSLLELATGNYAGMLNIAAPKALNRWEFGMKMLSLLGIDPGEYVRPAQQSDGEKIRPANLTLDVSRAQALLGTPLLTVDETIERISRQMPPPEQVVD